MGISIFAGEAEEGRLDEVLRDAWNGTLKPLYNYMDDLPGIESAPTPHLPAAALARNEGTQVELRSRPRLPVPVLVLHHHQRAGPQEPLPQRRRPRGDHPRELQAGHHVVLHHRRQHGPQQALGRVLRPADRAQGERGHRGLPDHPGRHPVPSHPALHRTRRAGPASIACFIGLENINPDNLLAAKKRQNKITEYRKMLQAWHTSRRLDLGGLHPRLPRRHARIDPARHGDHQEGAAARHPRAVHADAAARLGGPPDAVEAGRVDGPRPQQVRPASSRRASSEDERRASTTRPIATAWRAYYTPEHIETVARRHGAMQGPQSRPSRPTS